MASQSVSLDDVRVLNVALGWHEAVALVQEVASLTVSRGRMPDPDLVILSPLGELTVQGDLDSHERPVQALAQLLQSLLGGPGVPANLKQLVTDGLSEQPQHATVESFSKALAFFERPNRRADIAAVCTRAATAALQVRSDIELEQLRARRAKVSSKKTPPPPKWRMPPWVSAFPIKAVAVAMVAALVVGGGAVAIARIFEQPPVVQAEGDAGVSVLDAARLSLTQVAQAGLSAVGIVTSLTPPDAAATPAPPPAPTTPARRAARAAETPAPAPNPVDLTVRLDAHEPVGAPPTEIVTETPHREEPVSLVATAAGGAREYSSADADVAPATLIRPQIPTFEPADAASEEVGVLDLLVDELGAVRQVKLLSPTNRFQERMLVSAAKAWRFNPASRDGVPVPYRLRVRITI